MRAATPFALAALSTLAASQAGIPTCASNAALQGALSSGCQTTDVECLCKNTGFIDSIKSAISGSCTGSDAQAACAWGNSQCSSYGVSLPCDSLAGPPADTEDSNAGNTTPAPDAGATDAAASPSDTEDAGVNEGGDAASSDVPTGSSTESVTSEPTGTVHAGTMSSGVGTLSTLSTMTGSPEAGNSSMTAAGNMTHSATITAMDSAPTSAYTGAATTSGAKQGGILGMVAGVALMFAFF